MSGKPFLFPVFMADGWFVNTALPKRLGDREVHQLSPFGVLPGLPHQAVKYLKAEAKQRNWAWSSCDVMIAAHGSETGPAASECALYFARRVQTLMTFKQKVRTGFLAEEPFLASVARFSSARTLLLPFLAGTGGHLTDDIPRELKDGGFRGVLLPALGEAAFVPNLIAHSLTTAKQRTLDFDPMQERRLAVSLAPPPPAETASREASGTSTARQPSRPDKATTVKGKRWALWQWSSEMLRSLLGAHRPAKLKQLEPS